MSDMQDPLERAYRSMLDAAVAMGKAERAYEQALAEETYEYAVQVKIGAKWLFLGRGTGGHNFARNAFWFVKKENAQDYMAIGKDTSAPARIVRRRVSPVEVVND